jgi:hypothetical protein
MWSDSTETRAAGNNLPPRTLYNRALSIIAGGGGTRRCSSDYGYSCAATVPEIGDRALCEGREDCGGSARRGEHTLTEGEKGVLCGVRRAIG